MITHTYAFRGGYAIWIAYVVVANWNLMSLR